MAIWGGWVRPNVPFFPQSSVRKILLETLWMTHRGSLGSHEPSHASHQCIGLKLTLAKYSFAFFQIRQWLLGDKASQTSFWGIVPEDH